jgi:secondary thiamine-phosphate synthase enzyme
MEKFYINTPSQTMMIDITSQIREVIADKQLRDGICCIFIPHTTAAITINESADPDVKSDIIMELNKVIPYRDNYRHMEGNSAAHIKASIIGSSEIIFVENGNLQLGTWQGIFLCEFDGPRKRQVWIKLLVIN